MQMNWVVIAGYVSKTPEVRRLPSGTPIANVRVGESVRYADGGETRELTNWHSLGFYGKLAGVAQALKKGDNIYVDARIEQRQLTARDGSKSRTMYEIVVSQCHVIAPLRRGSTSADTAARKNTANGSQPAGAGVENDWPVAG
jgi:single-strand DNA-binding protein